MLSLLLVAVVVLLFLMFVAGVLLLRGRLQLVEDWRGAHKLLSMWIAGLTSSLVGWLADNSDAGLHAWNALPTALRNDVPSWARVALLAVIFFGSFAAARLIRQPVVRKSTRLNSCQ